MKAMPFNFQDARGCNVKLSLKQAKGEGKIIFGEYLEQIWKVEFNFIYIEKPKKMLPFTEVF